MLEQRAGSQQDDGRLGAVEPSVHRQELCAGQAENAAGIPSQEKEENR